MPCAVIGPEFDPGERDGASSFDRQRQSSARVGLLKGRSRSGTLATCRTLLWRGCLLSSDLKSRLQEYAHSEELRCITYNSIRQEVVTGTGTDVGSLLSLPYNTVVQ